MKIGSPLPQKKARIEIIPLIDIMFFLLAAFMLASLSMIRVQSIQMNLPPAASAKREFRPDVVNIAVDRNGDLFIDKKRVNLLDLRHYVSNRVRLDTNVPVYISGDEAASHGTVIRVLDMVRGEGVQKVSFVLAPAGASQ